MNMQQNVFFLSINVLEYFKILEEWVKSRGVQVQPESCSPKETSAYF